MTTPLTAAALLENFSFLSDWEERYAYLIELGKNLPLFPAEEKTDDTIVRGCTSQVWLRALPAEPGTVHFRADSDAHIVRGLIGLLLAIYDGQPKHIVREFDIKAYFSQLGLDEHLSPNRRNGFYAMVERIRALAA